MAEKDAHSHTPIYLNHQVSTWGLRLVVKWFGLKEVHPGLNQEPPNLPPLNPCPLPRPKKIRKKKNHQVTIYIYIKWHMYIKLSCVQPLHLDETYFYYHNNKNSLEDEFNIYFTYFLYFYVVILFKKYIRRKLDKFLWTRQILNSK